MWGFSGCLATLNYCLGLGPKPGPFSTSQLLGQVFGFRTKEPARKAETVVLCVCMCVLGSRFVFSLQEKTKVLFVYRP